MDQHDDQSFFNADLLLFGEMVAQKHDLGVGVESGFAFNDFLHIQSSFHVGDRGKGLFCDIHD